MSHITFESSSGKILSKGNFVKSFTPTPNHFDTFVLYETTIPSNRRIIQIFTCEHDPEHARSEMRKLKKFKEKMFPDHTYAIVGCTFLESLKL